jgi:hemolysin activation/secretion protein
MTTRPAATRGHHSPARWLLAACGAAATLLAGATALAEPDPAPKPAGSAVPAAPIFDVSGVSVEYGTAAKPVPEAEFANVMVPLRLEDGVLRAAGARGQTLSVRVGDLGREPYTRLDGTALNAISTALVEHLQRAGFLGVLAVPDPAQINIEASTDADLRKDDRTLRFLVFAGVVREVRTIASRTADDPNQPRVNPGTPLHNRVRERSPLQPGDFLKKRELDSYLSSLSRYPNRRVDVAIASAGGEPGDATLDYIITEGKPWQLYFQLSNTGTKQTDRWRERFGFSHTDLTGHDDVLQLDYVTAGFDETHAFSGSYELPLGRRLRAQVFGAYNEYTASEVGLNLRRFKGDGFNVGGQLAYEILARDMWWIDAVGGVRYEETTTRELGLRDGVGRFVTPFVGLRGGRLGAASSVDASLTFEFPRTDNDTDELAALGRTDPDGDAELLRADVGGGFFIEPLLFPQEFDAGGGGAGCTLAHELYARVRAQYSFGNRLVPTAEQVVGGFGTVRGYPESIIAADDALIFTGEYRFHVPNALPRAAKPGWFAGRDFRYAPTEAFGRADWDLILRGFVDVGWFGYSHRNVGAGERNDTLVGAGLGVEVQVPVNKINMNARLDWGVPLQGIQTGGQKVDVGDSRLHFVLTISF